MKTKTEAEKPAVRCLGIEDRGMTPTWSQHQDTWKRMINVLRAEDQHD